MIEEGLELSEYKKFEALTNIPKLRLTKEEALDGEIGAILDKFKSELTNLRGRVQHG